MLLSCRYFHISLKVFLCVLPLADSEIEKIFLYTSPLFAQYIQSIGHDAAIGKDLTKKEHILFTFLKAHEGQLCERETIVDTVWPEGHEMGVSDWAVDRLVSRIRSKLKAQHSPYLIETVVTRGYKLIKT